MYEILNAKMLTNNIYSFVVKAERVSASCLPGQFVIVRSHSDAERIPLTICDYDRENKTITLVFQVVGAGSLRLSRLSTGDFLHDVAGPLGCASELCNTDIDELKKKAYFLSLAVLVLLLFSHRLSGLKKTALTAM